MIEYQIRIAFHGASTHALTRHGATDDTDTMTITLGDTVEDTAVIALEIDHKAGATNRTITVADLRQLLAQRAAHEVTR